MTTYVGSTDKLDLENVDVGDSHVPKSKCYLVSGLCVVFAILLLVFIILFAKANGKKAETVAYSGGSKGGKPSKVSTTSSKPMTKSPKVSTRAMRTSTLATTITPTTLPEGPYNYYRLPKDIVPSHYNLELIIDLKNLNFSGTSVIYVNINKAVTYVLVHINKMNITSAVVTNNNGDIKKYSKSFENKTNQYYVLQFATPLAPGDYILTYKYEAFLTGGLKGLYKSTYKKKNGKEITIAATQFQPTDARMAFPCFDEPALKATFNVTLIHDDSYIALSNMPRISNATKNNLVTSRFSKSVKMPTYLLAFVICDFGMVKMTTSTGVSMTFYAPTDQMDQIDYAVKIGNATLPFFEKYYNITYPLPKADMIAIPDFAAGAMENWGLITYRETALLYKPGQSSEGNKQRVAIVIAHELAHMWFGNLVTTEWWSDLWLNEGFASYVEYLGVKNSEPSWKMEDQFVILDQDSALYRDSLVTSHPIYVKVKHPDEINEIFDSITYQKGATIIRMLDRFMGTSRFVKGLNSYLTKYSFGNAKTEDLWNSLSEATGGTLNISKIMDTWTRQMGYPVINVTSSGSEISLKQERFLLDPNPDYSKSKYNSSYGYKWYVPFEYTTAPKMSNSTSFNVSTKSIKKVWMNMDSASINGTDIPTGHWIKGNADQYGFYRVNYDTQGWKDLTDQMKTDHKVFSVKDRAGLLGDAFALARSSKLSYTVALDLFDYVDKEEDYVPWSAASSGIGYIGSVLTKTRPASKLYDKYIQKKIQTRYGSLGFKESAEGNAKHLETYLRGIMLGRACGTGVTSCLDAATRYFKAWMVNNTAVPADFRSLVYFYGIMNGGREEWDFTFKKYNSSIVATERIKLLYGMSAIQEPWMLQRYLEWSLDDKKIKSQDTSYIFSYIANSNPNGRFYAWSYMKSNWAKISKKFGGGFFAMRRIISSVTSGFNTKYELADFDKFVNSVQDKGTASRAITQARERIKSNIQWLERNENTVEAWLRMHV